MGDATSPSRPIAANDPRGEATEESPLARLRAAFPELTGALRTCAEFVLDHAWEMRGLSMRTVEARTGVSIHAVHRLARRLGYHGYRAFSQALTLELGRIQGAAYALPESLALALANPLAAGSGAEGSNEGNAESPAAVVSRVVALELAALRDTWQSIDPEMVNRAVRALAGADRLLFIGTGAGLALCQLGVYRFTVLGKHAACAGDPATMVAATHLLHPGDVVVAVSFHGASRIIVEGLEYARERGLTTIAITTVAGSPVTQRADVPLAVTGRDEALSFGQFASRVTTVTVLEALAAAVAWERRDTVLPHAQEVMRTSQQRNSIFSRGLARRRRDSMRG